jgi:hypothetical protein
MTNKILKDFKNILQEKDTKIQKNNIINLLKTLQNDDKYTYYI